MFLRSLDAFPDGVRCEATHEHVPLYLFGDLLKDVLGQRLFVIGSPPAGRQKLVHLHKLDNVAFGSLSAVSRFQQTCKRGS